MSINAIYKYMKEVSNFRLDALPIPLKHGSKFLATVVHTETNVSASAVFEYNTDSYVGDTDIFIRSMVKKLNFDNLVNAEFVSIYLHDKLVELENNDIPMINFTGNAIRLRTSDMKSSSWIVLPQEYQFSITMIGKCADPAIDTHSLELADQWVYNALRKNEILKADLQDLEKQIKLMYSSGIKTKSPQKVKNY